MLIWNVETETAASHPGTAHPEDKIQWSPDSHKIVIVNAIPTLLNIFDLHTATMTNIDLDPDDPYWLVFIAAWSPDGRLMATGGSDGPVVTIWNTDTWAMVK